MHAIAIILRAELTQSISSLHTFPLIWYSVRTTCEHHSTDNSRLDYTIFQNSIDQKSIRTEIVIGMKDKQTSLMLNTNILLTSAELGTQ